MVSLPCKQQKSNAMSCTVYGQNGKANVNKLCFNYTRYVEINTLFNKKTVQPKFYNSEKYKVEKRRFYRVI